MAGQQVDIRDLVTQPVSTDAVHDSTNRPTPTQLEARYEINRGLLEPTPKRSLWWMTWSRPVRIS
jgi:hypothetical protein